MLIELLRRSDADVVNKDVTECVLYWDCKVCEEEEEEEEEDCKVCVMSWTHTKVLWSSCLLRP